MQGDCMDPLSYSIGYVVLSLYILEKLCSILLETSSSGSRFSTTILSAGYAAEWWHEYEQCQERCSLHVFAWPYVCQHVAAV